MDTDQTGALNAVVTRGAFARMLTSFSTFRESVGAQGTVGTLYTDVPGTSPWAPYIRIAVQQGWLNGYTGWQLPSGQRCHAGGGLHGGPSS